MKDLLIFYRILSFILLPIAALMGIFGLFALFAALANPAFLFGVFMLVCIVIYVFTSFNFLSKGIISQAPCKPTLRDWIKVNAYVSIVFALLSLLQGFSYFKDPVMQKQVLDQGMTMVSQSTVPASISREYLTKIFNGTVIFMLFLGIILLIHIFLTFRLLVEYKKVFDRSE